MKQLFKGHILYILLSMGLLSGCGGLNTAEDSYGSTWEAVLQSNEWERSLQEDSTISTTERGVYYALPELNTIRHHEVAPSFIQTYPRLVSRAYFRLIAEALEADRRIANAYSLQYQQLRKPENANDPKVKQDFETARSRFLAHRQMLEGLRSWRAFHQDGSDDLDFFLEEQLRASFAMYLKGADEKRIVNHLMTELADLYHKEEGVRVNSL
jgi:hypothetical protein